MHVEWSVWDIYVNYFLFSKIDIFHMIKIAEINI